MYLYMWVCINEQVRVCSNLPAAERLQDNPGPLSSTDAAPIHAAPLQHVTHASQPVQTAYTTLSYMTTSTGSCSTYCAKQRVSSSMEREGNKDCINTGVQRTTMV